MEALKNLVARSGNDMMSKQGEEPQRRVRRPEFSLGFAGEPLPTYNALLDENLKGFFQSKNLRRILRRSGMITRKGNVVEKPFIFRKTKHVLEKSALPANESIHLSEEAASKLRTLSNGANSRGLLSANSNGKREVEARPASKIDKKIYHLPYLHVQPPRLPLPSRYDKDRPRSRIDSNLNTSNPHVNRTLDAHRSLTKEEFVEQLKQMRERLQKSGANSPQMA